MTSPGPPYLPTIHRQIKTGPSARLRVEMMLRKIRTSKFRLGEPVVVRSLNEIAATLDPSGRLEGLPFLPEMIRHCGRTLTVRGHVKKLIQEGGLGGMRRIRSVVLLNDAVCDGRAHGDCQRACVLLWKTAWIKRATEEPVGDMMNSLGSTLAGTYGVESILPRGRVCQVTELTMATKPLRLWDPRRYYWDMISGIYRPSDYLGYLTGGIFRNTFGRLIKSPPHHKAPLPLISAAEGLDLQPGDLVEVKSADEIRATLNPARRSQGLLFLPGMWAHCGCRLRVLHRVERIMSERTGEMRALKHAVILEGATCNGKAHGGCQRGCYVFWKKAWLRRVAEDRPGSTGPDQSSRE
jgi:hypothetical protein